MFSNSLSAYYSSNHSLTLLKVAEGRDATKTFCADRMVDYNIGKEFGHQRVSVCNFDDLVARLTGLEADPTQFVVFGNVRAEFRDEGRIRRLKHAQEDGHPPTLEDAGSNVIHFDVDDQPIPDGHGWHDVPELAAAVFREIGARVTAFGDVSCWYQASSSAAGANPDKAGLAKFHFWCLLDRPVSESERVNILSASGADKAVGSIAQPNYTAKPIFKDGALDPLPSGRSGVIRGARNAACVDDIDFGPMFEPTKPAARDASRRVASVLPIDIGQVGPAEITDYGRRALDVACRAIEGFPAGDRHRRNYGQACGIGRQVERGEIPYEMAQRELLAAAESTGHEPGHCRAEIGDGLRQGIRDERADAERDAIPDIAFSERQRAAQLIHVSNQSGRHLTGLGLSTLPPQSAMSHLPRHGVRPPRLVLWASHRDGMIKGGWEFPLGADGKLKGSSGGGLEAVAFHRFGNTEHALAIIKGSTDRDEDPVYVCESVGAALAVWQVTGCTVWCCIDAGGWQEAVARVSKGTRLALCPPRYAPGSASERAFSAACRSGRSKNLWIAAAPTEDGDLIATLRRAGADAVAEALAGAVSIHARRLDGQRPIDADDPEHREFVSLEDARERIRSSLRAAVSQAIDWVVDKPVTPPSAWALRVTVGVGKTLAALDAVAEAWPRIERHCRPVEFLVPTLQLAREHQDEFAARHPHIPSRVIEGRNALNCKRSTFAEKAGRLGVAVKQSLCEYKDANGDTKHSPCRANCPYWAQFDVGAEVTFRAHNILALSRSDEETPPLFSIVDESFQHVLLGKQAVEAEKLRDRWVPPPREFDHLDPSSTERRESDAVDLHTATEVAVDALIESRCPLEALRVSGYEARAIERFAEMAGCGYASLNASDSDEALERRLDALEASKQPIVDKVRGAFWRALAEEEPDRISCRKEAKSGRYVVYIHTRADAPEWPLICIDADADSNILELLLPGHDLMFEEHHVRQNLHTVQATRFAQSTSRLWKDGAPTGALTDAAAFIDLMCLRFGKDSVLVFAPGKRAAADWLKERVACDVEHYSSRVKGMNTYKGKTCVILVGRNQPPSDAIEDAYRALTRRKPPAMGEIYKRYPETDKQIEVQGYDDAVAQALLEQVRERISAQAVGRARGVSAAEPINVFVMSNVPVDDLAPAALVPDFGLSRLDRAIIEARTKELPGLRLHTSGLHQDAEREFPTEESAKAWLKREGRRLIDRAHELGVIPIIESLYGDDPLFCAGVLSLETVSLVEYRIKGQRGPHRSKVLLWGSRSEFEAAIGQEVVAWEPQWRLSAARPTHSVTVEQVGVPLPEAIKRDMEVWPTSEPEITVDYDSILAHLLRKAALKPAARSPWL